MGEPRAALPFSLFANAAPRNSPRMLFGAPSGRLGPAQAIEETPDGERAHGSIVSRKGAKSDEGRSAKASFLCARRGAASLSSTGARANTDTRKSPSKRDRGRSFIPSVSNGLCARTLRDVAPDVAPNLIEAIKGLGHSDLTVWSTLLSGRDLNQRLSGDQPGRPPSKEGPGIPSRRR